MRKLSARAIRLADHLRDAGKYATLAAPILE
jgi:hypothetical protein